MRAQLKRVHSPDVQDIELYVPPEPGMFGLLVQLMIGPEGHDGEESFEVVLCTPRWLAERVKEARVLSLRHHLLVDSWDWDSILHYVERFLDSVEAQSWPQVAAIIGRLGRWDLLPHWPATWSFSKVWRCSCA